MVCHASAWDVTFNNDLRIKMHRGHRGGPRHIHHELGHDYYFHYYYQMPVLFQQGANDGFHEAIGDALVLSMTRLPQAAGPARQAPRRRQGSSTSR